MIDHRSYAHNLTSFPPVQTYDHSYIHLHSSQFNYGYVMNSQGDQLPGRLDSDDQLFLHVVLRN